jgi:hypothetical protein
MKRILISILLIGNLAVAGWTYAQQKPAPSPMPELNRMDLVAPLVISGPDLGFRIDTKKDNVAVGKLVIRINGVWTDAQIDSSGVSPIAK